MIVPDKKLSLRQGAIKASGWNVADGGSIAMMYFEGLAEHYGFSLDTPYKELSKEAKKLLNQVCRTHKNATSL